MSFTKPQQKPKCARCAAPEVGGDVWGVSVCRICNAEWHADDTFSSGVINKHLGISDRPEDFTEANHQRYCAEAMRRTQAWVKAGRREAA